MAKDIIDMATTDNLFQEFAPVTTEAWTKAIERFLKGKPVSELNWEIEEGINYSPIQRKENTTPLHINSVSHKSNNNWNICEKVLVHTTSLEDDAAYQKANQIILDALNKGCNALIIELSLLPSTQQLGLLFQNVLVELLHIHFQGEGLTQAPIAFAKQLKATAFHKQLKASFSIPDLTLSSLEEGIQILPKVRWITISVETTSTTALSKSLHQASLWIDQLLNEGNKVEHLSAFFRFEFGVGNQYFVELAQIRAFKKLWLGLLEGYNASTADFPQLHATTLSAQEENQYWNMITATTQAMAAAIGGVDSIYVCPSNGEKDANDFTKRIARNVQHLLQSESYLNRVIDPAAGSYYIENLTAAWIEKSWQQFCNL